MSYTIEYAKLFLRSDSGYTPCWECGSNNVYESDRRRAREWCVWQNLLGVTPEEIMNEGLGMCNGGYHWQKGGKWLDDTALMHISHSKSKSSCDHAACYSDPMLHFLVFNSLNRS